MLKPIPLINVIRVHFPDIATQLDLLWGFPEFDTYIHSLIVTDRTDRRGFEMRVFDALTALANIHADVYRFGEAEAKKDPWAGR